MKKIADAKQYLVYVRKDLLEYLGLEKSQNILPVENRFNSVEESKFVNIKDNNGKLNFGTVVLDYIVKASYNKKSEAQYAINEIIYRTSKILANDFNFHISANNIAKVVKNEKN